MHTLSSPKASFFIFKNLKNVFIARSTIPTLTGPPKCSCLCSSPPKGGNLPTLAGGGTLLLLPETRVQGVTRPWSESLLSNATIAKTVAAKSSKTPLFRTWFWAFSSGNYCFGEGWPAALCSIERIYVHNQGFVARIPWAIRGMGARAKGVNEIR